MQVPFAALLIGRRFYRKKPDGSTDIRWFRMKVSTLSLTAEPSIALKITERALKAKLVNCVILNSPNNTDGHYDYIPPTDLIFVATKYVC
jgi:hypothetical protein